MGDARIRGYVEIRGSLKARLSIFIDGRTHLLTGDSSFTLDFRLSTGRVIRAAERVFGRGRRSTIDRGQVELMRLR